MLLDALYNRPRLHQVIACRPLRALCSGAQQEDVEDDTVGDTPYTLRSLLVVGVESASLELRDTDGKALLSASMQVRGQARLQGEACHALHERVGRVQQVCMALFQAIWVSRCASALKVARLCIGHMSCLAVCRTSPFGCSATP